MKRFFCTASCLLILLAGAAAAWADCARISFAEAGHHHASETEEHSHSHPPHSDHGHSHNAVIHCPTLDEFVPSGAFSAPAKLRVDHVPAHRLFASVLEFVPRYFFRSHGPPGPLSSARIPGYISLSVLRV